MHTLVAFILTGLGRVQREEVEETAKDGWLLDNGGLRKVMTCPDVRSKVRLSATSRLPIMFPPS